MMFACVSLDMFDTADLIVDVFRVVFIEVLLIDCGVVR